MAETPSDLKPAPTRVLAANEPVPSARRTDWFQAARFGLFVHWGPYAVSGRGEWVMNRERIPVSEYRKRFIDPWKAEAFDPAAWAALALEAGMGYVILTTRHHDGFCLWDTNTTEWNSVNLGPEQDLVDAFVKAVRAAGLKVGFYYSGADWTHRDYPGAYYRDWPQTEDWESEEARLRFVAHYREQVRELMTRYGKIDLLWWDGCQPEPFGGDEVNAMVRELQPEILINERNGSGFDFRNSEQTLRPKPGPWEACMTLNTNWGWHKGDRQWKTPKEVLQSLIEVAGKGGNLLINVGPGPDGRIPVECSNLLRECGAWLKRNPGFLANSDRHGLSWNNSCLVTTRGSRVYLHFYAEPGPEFCWAELKNRVISARFLATGEPIEFHQDADRLWLRHLPTPLPDTPLTTVMLEVEGSPEPLTETTSFWIPN